ncbi:MAG TPA: SRPBCC family protein [Nocardioides sp.]|nr:SRPBCC family protein [Nocardioides sp.]
MSTTQSEAVRFDVTVEAPVDRAFEVFTGQFDRIKPREHNLLAPEAIVETVFETHVGGHVYDRGENGSVCRWARVLAFEPPHRFVISWDISPSWQVVTDPAESSEVEVTFTAAGPGRTRVEHEHRHLERHGQVSGCRED